MKVRLRAGERHTLDSYFCESCPNIPASRQPHRFVDPYKEYSSLDFVSARDRHGTKFHPVGVLESDNANKRFLATSRGFWLV